MGEYWSVEACGWVTWPPASAPAWAPDDGDEPVEVPQPRAAADAGEQQAPARR